MSERRAVAVLWTLSAMAGMLAFVVRQFSNDWSWVTGGLFVLAMIIFAVYLAHVRVYRDIDIVPARGITPMVANFMYKRRVAEVLLDVCLVSVAYYAAWRMRFEGAEWPDYSGRFLESLPLVLGAQMVMLFVIGAYRGEWRHFGLMDAVVFAKSVVAGTAASVVGIVFLYHFQNYSRVVFINYAALLMLMLCATRASFRLMAEFILRRRTGLRLVVYGAGHGGALVMRELLSQPDAPYSMLGFIDDDPRKQNFRLHGYPVLGAEPRLLELVADHGVDVVVVSSREFDSVRLQQLANACQAQGIRLLRFQFNLQELVSCA